VFFRAVFLDYYYFSPLYICLFMSSIIVYCVRHYPVSLTSEGCMCYGFRHSDLLAILLNTSFHCNCQLCLEKSISLSLVRSRLTYCSQHGRLSLIKFIGLSLNRLKVMPPNTFEMSSLWTTNLDFSLLIYCLSCITSIFLTYCSVKV